MKIEKLNWKLRIEQNWQWHDEKKIDYKRFIVERALYK